MFDFDLFVSHASEDKEQFVRPLVEALRERHLEVWYDETELRPGDSLIRSVEKGLTRSRFGIIVLSPAFFEKRWPRAELDALTTRELATGESVLLPVWLGVGPAEVRDYSPLLADRYAVVGDRGIAYTASAIAERVRPGRSPVSIARELLADRGLATPPPNDVWWLDVVESSAEPEDGVHSGLRRWGFPLRWAEGSDAEARGARLAQAVMRDAWMAEAERRPITQLTPPQIVHEFIAEMPGLADTCQNHPRHLAAYAPQLLIPGFGGAYEDYFDQWLDQAASNRDFDTIGLRCASYDGLDAAQLTCDFVQGELFGPSVMVYEHIDYFFWVLSARSSWLPTHVREMFVRGFCEWAVWAGGPRDDKARDAGERLLDVLAETPAGEAPNRGRARVPLIASAEISRRLLDLPEQADELADRLVATGALEAYLRDRREREHGDGTASGDSERDI